MNILKKDFFSIIMVASRKSGKSELVKHIYTKLNLGEIYDFVIVMSQCNDSLDHFSNFVHGNLFIKGFNNEYLQNVMKKSDDLAEQGNPKSFLIIIDDVVGTGIKNSPAIMELYALGRHHHISVILLSQMVTLISTTARSNSDCLFIGSVSDGKEKTSVDDNLVKGLATYKEIQKYGYTKKS